MRRITTTLGDVWLVKEETASPINSDREYGLTEIMQRILKNSESNNRFAERLRIIANADVTQDGKAFLIPDVDHEGYSRPVSFRQPHFDWKSDDPHSGRVLFNTNNPDYIIREVVADPCASFGPYHLMKFDYSLEKFTLVGTDVSSMEDAFELMKKVMAEKTTPLPSIREGETTLLSLPNGYSAEVLLTCDIHEVVYEEIFNVSIIDRFGRHAGDFQTESASVLVSMRDDAGQLEELLEEAGPPKFDGILDMFAKAEVFYPRRFQDLDNCIDALESNRVVKLMTADDEYEVLLTWDMSKNIYRDQGGDFISEGTPSFLQLEGIIGDVSYADEPFCEVYVKRVNGVKYDHVKYISLDVERLYDLITSVDAQDRLFGEAIARLSLTRCLDDMDYQEKAPVPRVGHLIAGAVSMDHIDIVSNDKKRNYVNVNQLRRTLEKPAQKIDFNY